MDTHCALEPRVPAMRVQRRVAWPGEECVRLDNTGRAKTSAAQHERTGTQTVHPTTVISAVGSSSTTRNTARGRVCAAPTTATSVEESEERGAHEEWPSRPKHSFRRARGPSWRQQGANRRAASGKRIAYLLLHYKLCAASAPHRVPAPPFRMRSERASRRLSNLRSGNGFFDFWN